MKRLISLGLLLPAIGFGVTASIPLLAGCASSDGLTPGARMTDATTLATSNSLAVLRAANTGWPSDDWWKAYGDPQMDALVAEALAGNPSLRVARTRIEQADALASLADAARSPQLSGAAAVDRQRYSENGIFPPPIAGASLTTGQLGLSFSYEFDFWGRQRAALEAALSRARASAVEAEAAKLTLAAAVARSYVELDHQFGLRDIAEAALRLREQIRTLSELRVGSGLETQVELRQFSSSVFAARSDLSAADERIALLRNELAALLGQGPDRGLAIVRPQLADAAAAALPSKLPADLLGRRPDVLAQRLRVEAARGEIEAARARFYPNVDLKGFLAVQAVGLDNLLQSGSRIAGADAALSLPIFDGGRLRANLAMRDADYDLAVEQYNGTLVDALRDVADQVRSWHAIDLQSAEQRQAQAEVEEAHRLTLLRYRGGLSSYLGVLSVEMQVLAQRRLGADLRSRRFIASIGLARALAGGFRTEIPSRQPSSEFQESHR